MTSPAFKPSARLCARTLRAALWRMSRTHAASAALAVGATILATPAYALDLTTLAAATATASSCYTGCGKAAYDASNILDDDRGQTGNTGLNSWNSGGFGGWVQVDFGASYMLDRVELYGGYPYDNPFTLSVSMDGSRWTTLATGSYHLESLLSYAGTGGLKYGAVYDSSLNAANALASGVEARYLRYSVNAGTRQWGYLYEIEAQGHLAAAPVPEPSAALMAAAGLGLLVWRSRRHASRVA
ncbi:discoidin domain-containing protein [Ideonella sp. DXS22W]|uniref:Discoidin domain-containing protein n=1 Tax=Pseudaquabacterium inlustre TaxID=2984192 RepID=A0ABU9CLC5_9BURK